MDREPPTRASQINGSSSGVWASSAGRPLTSELVYGPLLGDREWARPVISTRRGDDPRHPDDDQLALMIDNADTRAQVGGIPADRGGPADNAGEPSFLGPEDRNPRATFAHELMQLGARSVLRQRRRQVAAERLIVPICDT